MVTGFSCHPDRSEAERRGLEGFQFFGFALAHYYLFGDHVPGRTSIWDIFQADARCRCRAASARDRHAGRRARARCASSRRPASTRRSSSSRAATTATTDICAALELFATEVMPEFRDRHEARQRQKAERLAPSIERALARRTVPPEPTELPTVRAYGRSLSSGASGYPKG